MALGRTPSKLSRSGARFIERFEGFRPSSYQDSVGVWTIGCGHTRGVGPRTGHPPDRPWSRFKGRRVLREDAAPLVALIKHAWNEGFKRPIRQRELDALISFGFNLGPGYFTHGHDIGDAIRAGKRQAVADAFLLYDKAGGHRLEGLTIRRRAERDRFLGR